MKKGDIVVAMTMAGEIVGKYINEKDGTVTLEDPRTLIQNEQGMGFAKGLCMSGKLDPKIATISNYVFITEASDEFESAWRQATSGLII
jgi:hypothetical protein